MPICIVCGAETRILKICLDCYAVETRSLVEKAREVLEEQEEYEDDYIHYSKYRNP